MEKRADMKLVGPDGGSLGVDERGRAEVRVREFVGVLERLEKEVWGLWLRYGGVYEFGDDLWGCWVRLVRVREFVRGGLDGGDLGGLLEDRVVGVVRERGGELGEGGVEKGQMIADGVVVRRVMGELGVLDVPPMFRGDVGKCMRLLDGVCVGLLRCRIYG